MLIIKNTFLVSLKSAFKAIVLNNLAIGILLGISFNLLKLEFSTHTEDLLKEEQYGSYLFHFLQWEAFYITIE